MSELAFAKQFLTALDSRPIKLSSDNVVDPKSYPPQSAYILPRLANAKRKRGGDSAATASSSSSSSTAAAQTSGAITVSLKPMKAGAGPSVTLPSQAPTKSAYDIKQAYAAQAGLDVAKIKLLRSKKPVADSKSLRDVLGEGGDEATSVKDPQKEVEVEFSVMVMPGAALSPAAAAGGGDAAATSVAQGPSGEEVVGKQEFWDDLQGFLLQRLRDDEASQKLVKTFRSAWESSAAKP